MIFNNNYNILKDKNIIFNYNIFISNDNHILNFFYKLDNYYQNLLPFFNFFNILFYILCLNIIILSFIMIFSKNPIYSIICLIFIFCCYGCILIFFNLDFLGIIYIIIYVGAIAILFLFVIMMLNIKILELKDKILKYIPISFFIIIILLSIFFFIYDNFFFIYEDFYNYNNNIEFYHKSIINIINSKDNIKNISSLLYTNYYIYFILSGIILLISMISSIALTLNHKIKIRRQLIFNQNNILWLKKKNF